MASITVTPTIGEGSGLTPSYACSIRRTLSAGSGETIQTIGHGAGVNFPSGDARIYIARDPGNTDKFVTYVRPDIVLDLREYMQLEITAATFKATCSGNLFMLDNIYTNTDKIGLYRQRESIRGTTSDLANFYEIYWGGDAYGGMSDTYHNWNTVLSGSTFSWPLNATGIAYLNSVRSKTYNPGYAFFGLDLKNNVDNEGNATWTNSQLRDSSFSAMWFEITYESTSPICTIDIGSAVKVVASERIAISGTWRFVVDIKIQIGGTWQDTVA